MTSEAPRLQNAAHLRGAARILVDASQGVLSVVEGMHQTIASHPAPLGRSPTTSMAGITGLVYRSIRAALGWSGQGIDLVLRGMSDRLPATPAGPVREALVSALNGIFGDALARQGNPLALQMQLHLEGRMLDVARPENVLSASQAPAGRRLLVLIHGLCMNDRQWLRDGHDHGASLAASLGMTPLYLRYNSGLPVAENGRSLAVMLEALQAHWPVPVERLVLLGHSMGGLVARSACAQAESSGLQWRQALKGLVCLGTPHLGAPLERGGHGLDRLLAISPYTRPLAALGQARSAGIRDLRHGTLMPVPSEHPALPKGVACFTVAATLSTRPSRLAERLTGDGLVPLDSALGRHPDPARRLAFTAGHQHVIHGAGHLDLLSRPEVAARLSTWLGELH